MYLDLTRSHHPKENYGLWFFGGGSGGQRKIPQQQSLPFSAVEPREMCGRKVQGAGKVDVVQPETFPFCSAAGSISLDLWKCDRKEYRWLGAE